MICTLNGKTNHYETNIHENNLYASVVCPSPGGRHGFLVALHGTPAGLCRSTVSVHILRPARVCREPSLDGLGRNSGVHWPWGIDRGSNCGRLVRKVRWVLVTSQHTETIAFHRYRSRGLRRCYYCSVVRRWER